MWQTSNSLYNLLTADLAKSTSDRMGNDTGNSQSLGDGSEGFSRCLPDDCVEYTISIIDSTLKDQYRREKLRKVQSSAISLTKGLLGDYIWQRDNFHLDLLQENGRYVGLYFNHLMASHSM